MDRADRTDRTDRTDRVERTDLMDRADRVDRTDMMDTTDSSDRKDRTERMDRTDRKNRTERTNRTDRTDRKDRLDQTDRTDRKDSMDGADRTDRTTSVVALAVAWSAIWVIGRWRRNLFGAHSIRVLGVRFWWLAWHSLTLLPSALLGLLREEYGRSVGARLEFLEAHFGRLTGCREPLRGRAHFELLWACVSND